MFKVKKIDQRTKTITLTFIKAHIYYFSGNEYLKEIALQFYKEEELKICCASYACSQY